MNLITVHLRVNDAGTGQPTPVRLRIASPTGEFFVPLGRSADFPLGRNEAVGGCVYLGKKKFIYIDGSCEIRLPTGVPLDVEITKGLEYEPIHDTITLSPGKMALRFTINRLLDSRADGWLSADTRCHFLSPHDALLEAAAEDVAFVNLLAREHDVPANDGHLYRTISHLSAFSGQRAALESGGHAVIVNTFNTHPALGRLGLLNSHRPVFPLSFGAMDETDDWSLADWCNQCHRKGGLTVWCDAFRTEAGLLGGEALMNLLLGKIDVVELDALERSQPFLPFWYRLLNAGCRASLVGSSGKDSNRTAIGSMRTYTLMPAGDVSLAAWVEQTRQGRTYVTNGPLLDFRVNGQPPGSRIALDGANLSIRAVAKSIVPFEKLEIVANGEVIAEASPTGYPLLVEIEREISLPEGGWIAARCRGSKQPNVYPLQSVFAHSSPIHVAIEGRPFPANPNAVQLLRESVDRTREWIETLGRFEQEKRKARLLELCDDAIRVVNSSR